MASKVSPSLAAIIPEELFERILWYVGDGYHVYPTPPDVKSALCSCASVCHYWAKVCRPKLFVSITLRSRDDLHICRALLDVQALPRIPSISQFIERLQARPDGTQVPWLHLVPLVIIPRLSHIQHVVYHHYILDASVLKPPTVRSLRTLHPALPRTLPSFYSCITDLELSKSHFKDADELITLLRGLKSLRSLDLIDISWTTAPSASSFLRLPVHQEDMQIHTTSSGDLCALWFLPALLARSGRRGTALQRSLRAPEPSLDLEDYRLLLDLFNELELEAPSESSPAARREWHVHRGVRRDGPIGAPPSMT